jgi:hypothetical protein
MASIINLVNELAIYQFASWSLAVSSGLDLTGCSAIATLRDNYESFTGTAIEVAFVNRTSGEIRLSLSALDTANLLPKTYVWDLLITTALGDVSRVRYGIAIVQAGVSENNSIAQVIAAAIGDHNADLLAHPDLQMGGGGGGGGGGAVSYETAFNQASLTIASILVLTHNLGTYPSGVMIFDNVGESIAPDKIEVLSTNVVAVTLLTFAPLSGTWRASIAP